MLSLKTNSISFQNVAMEPKIKDDPEMLEFVNQTLEQCNDLMVRKYTRYQEQNSSYGVITIESIFSNNNS